MIEWRKRLIRERVVDYFRARYERIKAIPKQGLFNHQCFNNAVEYATKNKKAEVWEVVIIDGGYPILHYINKDSGRFLETTLGYRADSFEYYAIRRIADIDHKAICGEFDRALESYTRQFTNWFDRRVLSIGRVL